MLFPLSFHFILGFIVSFIGSIPPASINLITIKIAASKGLNKALWFALGAVIIEFIYSYIAIAFSNQLTLNQPLSQFIQWLAIPIFLLLAYLYFIQRKSIQDVPLNETETQSIKQSNTFLQGLGIGLMNIIQIPFWLAYGTYFSSIHWIKTYSPYIFLFVIGICCGTFALLSVAAYYGKAWLGDSGWFKPNQINKWLSYLFLLLALIQLLKILLEV
ncbi:MAG: LysE family transporter [Cytophagaceae bacterium]|jgi:threonine/homoserine/homoserine lactone efflux protein|nr:LysE family transporter [Cytophagaceae bacterium]